MPRLAIGGQASDHAGSLPCYRCASGSVQAVGHTQDRQHRPGQSIYRPGICRCREKPGLPVEHGWSGRLAGQCLCRTRMALGEIRVRLSPCLRFGGSSQNLDHAVRGVVQSLKTTFQPGSKNALSSLYRSVATGQNGSVIIGRDFTLKSMIAVQRFRATSVCIVPAHWNKVKSTRNAL
jgi:hypothetical protein